MFSVMKTAKCKKCGKEDQYDVSSGVLAEVNGREDVEYTLIRCDKCGKEMLLALDVVVTKTNSKEDIEEAITERAKELFKHVGNRYNLDEIKEIVREKEIIMVEEDWLVLEEEVDTVEYTGVFM